MEVNTEGEKRYILGIDAGSTGIRALIFDRQGLIVSRHYRHLPARHPEDGAAEYDPETLWQGLLEVVREALGAGLDPGSIEAMGICNQRATFCLWERETGKPVIPFIGWQDVRGADIADRMNSVFLWRGLKTVAWIVRKLTGSPMMTTTSMLRITTDHASCRLKWVFSRNPGLQERCRNGEILFGTLDTWFIYRLTGGAAHVTDYSNASATAMFNPFALKWNRILCGIFGIPLAVFPRVADTDSLFGETLPSLFNGVSIPIHAVCGDQQAALFGHCCFDAGEVKISQGTGAFVDINVGPKEKLSKRGLFPLIAWKIGRRPTYMLEGYMATAGALIDWLGYGMGLSNTPKALNDYAAECTDTEGVIFIPTPSGIRFPFFNPRMRATILGLSLATHRRHLARAVLEGIALRVLDIIEGIEKDAKVEVISLKVDGGVSKSDILLQCLADFADLTVKRAPEADMTATGAAYMAGLGCGFWHDLDELRGLGAEYDTFTPNMSPEKRKAKIDRWRRAVRAVLSVD